MRISNLLIVTILSVALNAFSFETIQQSNFNAKVRCVLTVLNANTDDYLKAGTTLELTEKPQIQEVLGFRLEAKALPQFIAGSNGPILSDHVQKIVISISEGTHSSSAQRFINDRNLAQQEISASLSNGDKRAEVDCLVIDR